MHPFHCFYPGFFIHPRGCNPVLIFHGSAEMQSSRSIRACGITELCAFALYNFKNNFCYYLRWYMMSRGGREESNGPFKIWIMRFFNLAFGFILKWRVNDARFHDGYPDSEWQNLHCQAFAKCFQRSFGCTI